MVVTIISGGEGTGKTTQLLRLVKEFGDVVWGILELKDVEEILKLKSSTFQPTRLYQVYEDGTKLQGNVDPIKTLEFVRNWRDMVYKTKPFPQTIVIDGISDLRDYVIKEWIINKNTNEGKNYKSMGKNNLSGWAEVNNEVQAILEPLINKALLNHINLFMTAGVKEKFLNGEIVGFTPDYKPWMSRSVQCLIQLSCVDESYNLKCTKEPENPRWHVDNIPKGTGLLSALRVHNLVEQAVITFMIVYDEGGEIKRAFIKAKTAEEAKKEFLEQIPEGNVIEVSK